jgi:hypothetical protein
LFVSHQFLLAGPRRSVWKNCRPLVKNNRATGASRRFEFQKRSQLLIRAHNKTLSVVPMSISNPVYSPLRVHG